MMTLQMLDAETGELVATNSAARFREDNAEDAGVQDAIDRMERGEITSARIGFYALTVLYPGVTS